MKVRVKGIQRGPFKKRIPDFPSSGDIRKNNTLPGRFQSTFFSLIEAGFSLSSPYSWILLNILDDLGVGVCNIFSLLSVYDQSESR